MKMLLAVDNSDCVNVSIIAVATPDNVTWFLKYKWNEYLWTLLQRHCPKWNAQPLISIVSSKDSTADFIDDSKSITIVLGLNGLGQKQSA